MAGKRMIVRFWYPLSGPDDKIFEFFIKEESASIVEDICKNKMGASYNTLRRQYQFKSKEDAALARDKIADLIV